MNKELNKELLFYNELNLRWTFRDMFLFNELGFLVNDINDKENTNALVAIIYCGLSEKHFDRAVNIVVGWVNYFKSLDSLRVLVNLSLKDIHKFITTSKKEEKVVSVFDESNTKEEKKSREELVYDERQKLLNLIYVFYDLGYKVEEALEQDLKYMEYMKGYSNYKREIEINDNLFVIFKLGMLVGIGVNNPTHYPESIDNVKLTQKTKFDQLREEREGYIALRNRFKE